jgi:hypothetical protein
MDMLLQEAALGPVETLMTLQSFGEMMEDISGSPLEDASPYTLHPTLLGLGRTKERRYLPDQRSICKARMIYGYVSIC